MDSTFGILNKGIAGCNIQWPKDKGCQVSKPII